MQLTIIRLPPGEQIASLSHTLDSDELTIGQSEACLIRLPDQHNKVADKHILLTRTDNQWTVENISDLPASLNQADIPSKSHQRLLLSDGDILSLGEYQLAVSDYNPWLNPETLMETPPLITLESQESDCCVLPTTNETTTTDLDDPFAESPLPDSPPPEQSDRRIDFTMDPLEGSFDPSEAPP